MEGLQELTNALSNGTIADSLRPPLPQDWGSLAFLADVLDMPFSSNIINKLISFSAKKYIPNFRAC